MYNTNGTINDININNLTVKKPTLKKPTLNLVTFKNINRIIKDIKKDNTPSISKKNNLKLKNIGILNIFMKSDIIADKKYPSPNDKEYLEYRINHFILTLRAEKLIIG